MAFLAIRKSALAAMPVHVRKVIRFVFQKLDLMADGQIPPTMTSAGIDYFVWCSPLFTVDDAAVLTIISTNLDKIPDPDGNGEVSKAEIRRKLRLALSWAAPEIPEGEDPFAYTLTALGAPAALKMWNSVPEGWTPKEEA
jgi:hypothetical protein